MARAIVFEERFEVPMDIGTLGDFRRWALSDDYPERGRMDYLGGRIEVDMSPEDLFTHGTVKTELVVILGQRVKKSVPGSLFTDSARVSSVEADLSAEPDLVLVTDESLDEGRVRLIEKAGAGENRYIELEGAPDLVVEIVSDNSVNKDTRRLPAAYFKAGVREFWLVDARGKEILFQIQRREDSGFEPVSLDADGFQSSVVLGCRYRLDRSRNAKGRWVYDLREKT